MRERVEKRRKKKLFFFSTWRRKNTANNITRVSKVTRVKTSREQMEQWTTTTPKRRSEKFLQREEKNHMRTKTNLRLHCEPGKKERKSLEENILVGQKTWWELFNGCKAELDSEGGNRGRRAEMGMKRWRIQKENRNKTKLILRKKMIYVFQKKSAKKQPMNTHWSGWKI